MIYREAWKSCDCIKAKKNGSSKGDWALLIFAKRLRELLHLAPSQILQRYLKPFLQSCDEKSVSVECKLPSFTDSREQNNWPFEKEPHSDIQLPRKLTLLSSFKIWNVLKCCLFVNWRSTGLLRSSCSFNEWVFTNLIELIDSQDCQQKWRPTRRWWLFRKKNP